MHKQHVRKNELVTRNARNLLLGRQGTPSASAVAERPAARRR